MANALQQLKVPFPPNSTIRELLNQPEISTFAIEQVFAILVSSRRLSDVMTYLHKPQTKPHAPAQLPGGSIFRGMVFGHISIYTNRASDPENAVVLINPAAKAPPPPPSPARMTTPASAPKKAPVKMVGMPSKKPPREPAAPPGESPVAADQPIHESASFISDRGGAPMRRAPSEEKLKRWTEIVPTGTRSRRPAYPGTEEAQAPDGPPDAPRALDTQPTARMTADPMPHDIPPEDRVALAQELDHLIVEAATLIESIDQIPAEERADLVSEMRMLRMELDKFEPGIVRITEMIMIVSDVVETQAHVARIKECLRGLGLLL